MKNATKGRMRIVLASVLVLLFIDPSSALALSAEDSAQAKEAPAKEESAQAKPQAEASTPQSSPAPAEKPAAPQVGPSINQPVEQLPDSPGAVSSSGRDASQEAASQNEGPPKAPTVLQQKPVGTAAAEAPSVRGTGASKPAGFAIAPGKQRQSRSFLIKVGAVLGAGAALGTVMALSMASPSKPPGAK